MKAALFDFDGTLVDTEPIYDIFWNKKAAEYRLGIGNFARKIKGTTMPHILETYFSHFTEEQRQQLIDEALAYEAEMDFPVFPGALDFVRMLKGEGMLLGLVTSSENWKIERAFVLLGLHGVFDTVVTADRVTHGKPDPMCYRLALSDLQLQPADAIVFEDAFAGIQAATAAGLRVIGLSTTNPEDALRDRVHAVIPGFKGVNIERVREWFC
ncbi:MAG: HAD family phosphatase [Parabacteroides sp.]|nr:HAD family phosphatase [Parabacteroides sp.]